MKWHYTVGVHVPSIVKDGVIRPATRFVPPGEKPIVWFSTHPDWEPTANKNWPNPDGSLIRLDRAGTAEKCGGLERFGVADETAPYRWQALKDLSGMSRKMAQGLYDTAIRMGARPSDWWGTFDAVPRSLWIAVQVHSGGVWLDAPETFASPP
jgi:hypothetical protein